MKILSYSRIFSDKTVSLLRSLNSTSRVNVFAIQERRQHTEAKEKDAPVELDNPYKKERRVCILCKYNIEPDYKNVRLLSQFQSRFTGKIYERHVTGLCKSKQEKLETEVYKAQHAGLMGYYTKEVTYVNDPKLFDVDRPFKPHKY